MGIWPAFWLLGANFPQVGWPACGEIDIMEFRGQEPGVMNGTLHATGYSGGGSLTEQYTCQVAPSCASPPCTPLCPFNEDFHVFAVEVEANRIRFEVDGTIYHEVRQDLLPTGTSWPFGKPFFLILNVAVGGTYVGAPDVTTVFPQTMLVDYVRYYQLDAMSQAKGARSVLRRALSRGTSGPSRARTGRPSSTTRRRRRTGSPSR